MNSNVKIPPVRRGGRGRHARRRKGLGTALLAAVLFAGFGGSVTLAVNGEFKGSAVGVQDPDPDAPRYTVAIDTDFTSDGINTIPSGNVRDTDQPLFASQDKGVGVIIDVIGVVITNSLEEAVAGETDTQVRTTAFSQLNCGLNSSGQRFCLGSMSTKGDTRLRGKKLVVEAPGGYSHILAVEGCVVCSASTSADSAFTAAVDDAAVASANAALTAAYPALEPIEALWAFDLATIGNPGAVQFTVADGFSATEVFANGPLVTNVTNLASPASASYIFTPELLYWNGMWIFCDGGVLSRDTCRLA